MITVQVTPVDDNGASGTAESSATVIVNSSPPAVSDVIITRDGFDVTGGGGVEVNDTLTIEYTFEGTNSEDSRASTFQWQRDGNPISGATSRQYTVTGEDVVGSSITVQVTPVDDNGASGTAEISATVIVNNSPPAVRDVIITRDGFDVRVVAVNDTLTVVYTFEDANSADSSASTFQWQRDGNPIPGATSRQYTVTGDVVGSSITVQVTPVDDNGASGTVESSATAFVLVIVDHSPPTVSDVIITRDGFEVTEAMINDTLTVEYQFAAADSGDTDASTIQWQRDGNPILGATARQYTVTGEDVVSASITVQVTPVDDNGASGTAESSATGVTVIPAIVVINEVDADQAGTDAAEFIELYDGGVGDTDLSALVLVFYNGSNDASYRAFALDGQATDSDGYFVLCGDSANVPNCDSDVTPNIDLIQNGADAVALYTGEENNFPTGTAITTTNLLDAVAYDTSDADDDALLVLLNSEEPQVDEAGNGDKDGHANQRCPNGSGGRRYTNTYAQFSPTPGKENTCVVSVSSPPTVSDVIITKDGSEVTEAVINDILAVEYQFADADSGDTDASAFQWQRDGNPISGATARQYTVIDEDVVSSLITVQVTPVDDKGTSGTAEISATGVTVISPPPAIVVINEVDADQAGTDNAEFIELYDGGVGNTDLSALVVVFYNGRGDVSYEAFALDGQATDSDGYFVLCGDSANVPNCDLDVTKNTSLIQNGADAIALYTGEENNFPNDTPVTTTDLLDAVVYDTSDVDDDDDDDALLVLLNSGEPQVNEAGNGDGVGHSNQRCPNGSGGQRNSNTYDQFPPTPGKENTCGGSVSSPPPVIVVINEVDADQASRDNAEFIELFDGGAGNTDLSALVLVFYNGSNDASYRAFALDGQATDSDGYFVLCGDSANVPNCDSDVTPNIDLIQNGADAVALYTGEENNFPTGTAITTTNLLDAVAYDTSDADDDALLVLLNSEEPQVDEAGNGDKDGHSNQRCPNGSGGRRNTNTYDQYPPTPGKENTCGGSVSAAVEFGQCFESATFIHAVQGSESSSPIAATNVVIEGVVVGDFQETNQLSGFYLQEEDTHVDGLTGTSEGIFVRNADLPVDVGDLVRVQGDVTELSNLTGLNNIIKLEICGPGYIVTPATIALPVGSLDELEQVEGMQIDFAEPLSVIENFNLGRFGEVHLSTDRIYQYTHNNAPDADGYAGHQAAMKLNRIILDDGSTVQNPEPIVHPTPGLTASNTLRAGSTVNPTGILSEAFGSYRVQPISTPVFTDSNPRPAAPEAVGGSITVAAVNVLNYFTTIDTGGARCGPSLLGCRGADSSAEFTRQRDKTIDVIVKLNADIVGLVEMENNALSIPDLVTGVNAVSEATYVYIAADTIGTDAIKVGFIYKEATISPVGDYAILDSSVDAKFIDTKNRPVLAQTFSEIATKGTLTIAVNHLKSKGSACDDADMNDGQGNCNITRTDAATALVTWLATDPTNSGDDDFLIIGDLNSYAMEDPITAIINAGYTNLLAGESDPYSYVFRGEWGYLDYALSNDTLSPQITGITEWHINSDEPGVLDYNVEFKSATQLMQLYSADAYRASDHDPILIGLKLSPPPPPPSPPPP